MTRLTKKQLVEYLADEVDLTQVKAKQVIDELTGIIRDGLANGHDFVLPGIGRFSVRERAARAGRNPRTGEAIRIPSRRVVTFKPAKALEWSINDESISVRTGDE